MSYVIFNLQKHIMHMGTIWGEGFSHLFLRPPETKTFIGLYMPYGLIILQSPGWTAFIP